MYGFSFRTLTFSIFALFTILSYYLLFPFHGESSSLTLSYVGIIGFLYISYKAFFIGLEYKNITIKPVGILLLFLLHLFILCYIFFFSHGAQGIDSIYLFFRIVFLVLVLGSMFFVFIGLGKKILSIFAPESKKRDILFVFLLSFAVGFVSFLLFLSVLAVLGIYTAFYIISLLVIIIMFSYKEIGTLLEQANSYEIQFTNHKLTSKKTEEILQPYLLSTEFLFIVITLIISVSFISVIRPYPIGWDDLGVYMNYPKLIAAAGGNIPIGKTYLWELFTGIGFLFNSQTTAFFINSFSAVFAFFSLFLGCKLLLPTEKKSVINIPLLLSAVFISLPMVIFQVAKDMKLDIGLFTISFLAVALSVYVLSQKKEFEKKEFYTYLVFIGGLIGAAFAIKLTSLLLISSIFGLIAFRFFKLTGFLGYICIYIAIFTFGGLWKFMNVVFPMDNMGIVYGVSLCSFVLGVALLGYSVFVSKKGKILELSFSLGAIILGMIIVLLPWQLKHFSEMGQSGVSISTVLSGVPERFTPDYGVLYDDEELQVRESQAHNRTISSSGSTQNEDLGRYFGYESGINNYMKLPWNLTMQENQKGEFTDITYIFFALIPAIFLFLPFRKKTYILPVAGVLLFEILYFGPSPVSVFLTKLFSTISLPVGYLFIFLPFIGSIAYFYYCLDRTYYTTRIFLYLYSFIIFYYFLWTIAAFGIVWYGITMYGGFLLLIGVSILSIYERGKHHKGNNISYIVFAVIAFYFVQSSVPHALSNLQKAGSISYKTGQISESVGLFQGHPEYLEILFALNIADDHKKSFLEKYKKHIQEALQGLRINKEVTTLINNANSVSVIEYILKNLSGFTSEDQKVAVELMKKNIHNIHEEFYTEIISPDSDVRSQAGVYRVGTFLKYFITQNHSRLLEDSLVTSFDTYFYDDSHSEKIFERMKGIGISYLLIDLNAATIDNDPRKDLTRRYENLLKGLVAENVELIKSDSLCLQVALDTYRLENDIEIFRQIAAVNHRGMSACLNVIHQIIHSEKLTNYKYLDVYKTRIDADISEKTEIYQQVKNQMQQQRSILYTQNPQLKKEDITDSDVYVGLLSRYINQGFKALFKIK